MKTNQYTTFWQFLQGQKIEIPIIQRDYAQGRNGKEKLREKFLSDIKKALDLALEPASNNPETVSKLKLDFVYGTLESEKLQPLDGQQRLTTLWLLHWYLAHKAGVLANYSSIFERFTYETRTSSREFCQRLSEFTEIKSTDIISHIQNQTWFYSVWKQDPTIKAMLNMLGGTALCEKDVDIIDGIEELFQDNFEGYWNLLTSERSPIIFYYMPLSELKLSDDLYIKMNARGKALTSFENFKADLVGYMKSKIGEDNHEMNLMVSEVQSFESKLDTIWTDIFWKNRSKSYRIDEIYLAFLNRYFLNSLIISGKSSLTQNEIESNKLFRYLYGEEGNDTKVTYYNFDIYESGNLFNKEFFKCLECLLDHFNDAFLRKKSGDEINKLFLPSWDENSNFRFIPEYVHNDTRVNDESGYIPGTITQPQRVVFHAICCYFEKNQYDEISFKQWMRVIWNIVENANVNSIESLIGALQLVDELKPYSTNIYQHFADSSFSLKSKFATEQIKEEIQKAKQIENDSSGIWETKITEAEKTAFFKGAIRFMYKTDDDNIDWNKFDNRYKMSTVLFDKNGVAEEYRKDAILLRALISHFTKWEQFWDIVYDNNHTSWKSILTATKWVQPVSNLLDTDILLIRDSIEKPVLNFSEEYRNVIEDLVCSTLLANILDGCKLNWRSGYNKYALYPPGANANWKKYVVGDPRNKVFFELLKKDIVSTNQNFSGIAYFWGWDIYFTCNFNNKKYLWWDQLKVQLETGEWKVVKLDEVEVDLNNLENYLLSQRG